MRTFEEIRRSVRRRAIAKLCALGLAGLALVAAAGYGLYLGAQGLWTRLTAPRTVVLKVVQPSAFLPPPPPPPPSPTVIIDRRPYIVVDTDGLYIRGSW
jgi:hypothetical protein